VTKTSSKAIVYITKIEAARRQINAAIMMSILKIDELAIHTVAAAGYRIIRDLLEKRGDDEDELTRRAGLFGAAKAMMEGQLRDEDKKLIEDSESLRSALTEIADGIKEGLTIDNIKVINIPNEVKKKRWSELSKSANFLKHADRDSRSAIVIDDIDNEQLIVLASSAYSMLTRRTTIEMDIFYVLACANSPDRFLKEDGKLGELTTVLSSFPPSRRAQMCRTWISMWYRPSRNRRR
jgi:hypothetical protein